MKNVSTWFQIDLKNGQALPQRVQDVWELADGILIVLLRLFVIPLGGAATKKAIALEEKEQLLDHFHRWVDRRGGRYLDMYHRQAIFEIIEFIKSLAMDLAHTVNTQIQDIIPTYTEQIMKKIQNAHEDTKAQLNDFAWLV